MADTIHYTCPNCAAPLSFDAGTQKFSCEFCMSSFSKEELDDGGARERVEEKERAEQEFSDAMHGYQCPNCGAEVIADEATASDFCCYCHTPVILTERVTGALRPDKVVPFAFDKEEAKKRFKAFVRPKKFLPRDYFADDQIDKITGIYYPFWVTDADTAAVLDEEGKKVRVWYRGDYKYVETTRFHIERAGDIHFEDIVTSAISDGEKQMLEGILPFPADAETHKDFDPAYLSGFLSKKRDLDRENVNGEVRGRINLYAKNLLQRTVSGYHDTYNTNCEVEIRRSSWEYTLMPIWFLNYVNKKGKKYTFAMNGHTGKIYGELPVSFGKLAIFFGALTLGIGLLIFLLSGFCLLW